MLRGGIDFIDDLARLLSTVDLGTSAVVNGFETGDLSLFLIIRTSRRKRRIGKLDSMLPSMYTDTRPRDQS